MISDQRGQLFFLRGLFPGSRFRFILFLGPLLDLWCQILIEIFKTFDGDLIGQVCFLLDVGASEAGVCQSLLVGSKCHHLMALPI